MKATILTMGMALLAIVGITYYLRGGLPPLASDTPQMFQLAEAASSPSQIPLIQAPLLEEPFQDSPSSSTPSVVSVSDAGYDAMTMKQRTDFLNSVQQVIRHELLSARQLEHPGQGGQEEEDCEENSDALPSEHQGKDYKRRCEENGTTSASASAEKEKEKYRCPKNPDGSCPPVPDMTKYIRKDQIPCWGCSIDY